MENPFAHHQLHEKIYVKKSFEVAATNSRKSAFTPIQGWRIHRFGCQASVYRFVPDCSRIMKTFFYIEKYVISTRYQQNIFVSHFNLQISREFCSWEISKVFDGFPDLGPWARPHCRTRYGPDLRLP